MNELIWAVLCKHAIEDKRTNNVSLIEAVTQLKITVPPNHPQPLGIAIDLVLATLWRNKHEDAGETSSFDLRMQVVSPSGDVSLSAEKTAQVNPNATHKWFVQLKGIKVSGEGDYYFNVATKSDISERWETVASVPLRILLEVEEGAEMHPVMSSEGKSGVPE